MDFDKIKKLILEFRDARDRKQFHNPKDLATAISIEASELQERFLRKNGQSIIDEAKSDEVKEEFADIFNYLILFADACKVDIESAVLNKIEKNNKKYPVEKAKGKSDKYTEL